MPFALDANPDISEVSEAVNYLLANFGPNLAADPVTGQITGPSGIVIAYLYRYLSVKYADSFDGALNFSNSPTGRGYYGVNNSNSSTESTNPADYIWYKVAGGFGTTKFLFYQVTGGRSINFVVATSAPTGGYIQDVGTAIDLDIITSGAQANSATTAYLIQSQSDPAPSGFPQYTSGNTLPTGWSATLGTVHVGDVAWYSFGQYNGSSIAVNGIPANSTYWSTPVAASIFQDIRSDNWNGYNPPVYGNPATYGTTGYYISRSTGNVYFNNGAFRGDISTQGQGKFAGQNNSSFSVPIGGTYYTIYYSAFGQTPTTPAVSSQVNAGLFGQASSLGSTYNVGIMGSAANNGVGAVGDGDLYGGFFSTSMSSGTGLSCRAYSTTNVGFQIQQGTFQWYGITWSQPAGTGTKYLRDDGTWSTPSGSGTVTSVSGTGNVYGLTLSGTVTTSGSLTLGGSFNTASIPLSAVNLSGSNITARLIGTSGNTSGVTDVTFSGTLTGGASGTITWTMGTSTAAININVTSDSRLKKDIVDLSYGLDFVKKLHPVQFKWNHELFSHYGNKQAYGFLANEVEEIVGTDTTMVTTIEQGPLEGYKSFSNDGIVAALVKSVQELSAKVDALEAKLANR